jgi:hypothetical protein
MPVNTVRQINTTINWFIWKGEIFKVSLSTMQLPKREGGWNLVNIQAKSKALYYRRMMLQGHMKGTLTAGWLRYWGMSKRSPNPPDNCAGSSTLEYLRVVYTDSAYIGEKGKEESTRGYK